MTGVDFTTHTNIYRKWYLCDTVAAQEGLVVD